MILPVQITFRNVDATPEIEEDIRSRVQKLETFYAPITSCRVLVEAPARHRQTGYPFHIRIDLTVPEGEIVVRREPTLYPMERDIGDEGRRKQMETRPERKHLKVAIREAFDATRRRLHDHARRIRADVKTHEPPLEGRVTKLFPVDGYGFIETPDEREIYFHANSVINRRFKSLKIGSKVSFAEEAGEKGPQASSVRLITRARSKGPLPPVKRSMIAKTR
jgi:cold shock CspA family protein/ribosome-associated translation inhibitor RaiA